MSDRPLGRGLSGLLQRRGSPSLLPGGNLEEVNTETGAGAQVGSRGCPPASWSRPSRKRGGSSPVQGGAEQL